MITKPKIISKAFIVGTHPSMFRAFHPGKITGVVIQINDDLSTNMCYKIKWADGVVDIWSTLMSSHYEIIPYSDVLANRYTRS